MELSNRLTRRAFQVKVRLPGCIIVGAVLEHRCLAAHVNVADSTCRGCVGQPRWKRYRLQILSAGVSKTRGRSPASKQDLLQATSGFQRYSTHARLRGHSASEAILLPLQ